MSNRSIIAKPGQYLTFSLKEQTYGVPIAEVREINRLTEITPIPQTPIYMAGVINLRGKVVPVVNLRLKFGMEYSKPTKNTCIIVFEGKLGQVGVIVDSVKAVHELQSEQIEPTPQMGDDKQLSFLIGMGKIEDKVIILLDLVEALAGFDTSSFVIPNISSNSEAA